MMSMFLISELKINFDGIFFNKLTNNLKILSPIN